MRDDRHHVKYGEYYVTLYTDAGFKDGRCRAAYLARANTGKHWTSGVGEANVSDSYAAEALAVLFGLRCVMRSHPGTMGIHLRSDCLRLVERLQRKRNKWTEKMRPGCDAEKIIGHIRDLCNEHKLRLRIAHVRAHGREENEVRRWMNEQVDRMSSMRSATAGGEQ